MSGVGAPGWETPAEFEARTGQSIRGAAQEVSASPEPTSDAVVTEDSIRKSGRLATQSAIIRSELFWGVGVGDPAFNQSSPRMEP